MSDKPPAPDLVIPNGYRQGLITSITVILAFSLAFLRFAAFEPASGPWTFWGVVCVALTGASVLVQMFTLRRALQPADDRLPIYTVTLRWLAAGVALMIASLAADGVGVLVYAPPPPETWQSAAARTIRDCADRAHMLAQIVPQTDEKSAQAFCAMERSLHSN